MPLRRIPKPDRATEYFGEIIRRIQRHATGRNPAATQEDVYMLTIFVFSWFSALLYSMAGEKREKDVTKFVYDASSNIIHNFKTTSERVESDIENISQSLILHNMNYEDASKNYYQNHWAGEGGNIDGETFVAVASRACNQLATALMRDGYIR